MASAGDPRDNPLALNVVPMVDVIFCLCVFFMCSMKFKQVEGRFDAWLPKDRGTVSAVGLAPDEPAARLAIFWDDDRKVSVLKLGNRIVRGEGELEALLREARADAALRKQPDAPAVLDADGRVPWGDVVGVVNLCRRVGIADVRFALGAGPAGKDPSRTK
jgi:biopolymer transport protein ExbD